MEGGWRYFCLNPKTFAASNPPPPGALDEELAGKAIAVPCCPGFFRVPGSTPIHSTTAFRDGSILAMDLASGIAVRIFTEPGNARGLQLLELCCAPGMKLASSSLLLGSKASYTGVDISRHRLHTAASIIKRYRCENVRLFLADATRFSAKPHLISHGDYSRGSLFKDLYTGGQAPFYSSTGYRRYRGVFGDLYDRVLVDAQCTHDSKERHAGQWKGTQGHYQSAQELDSLYRLQQELLKSAYRLTAVGGFFLYCTCSIKGEQTKDVVREFLTGNPNVTLADLSEEYQDLKMFKSGSFLEFSSETETNDFFIAKFYRQ